MQERDLKILFKRERDLRIKLSSLCRHFAQFLYFSGKNEEKVAMWTSNKRLNPSLANLLDISFSFCKHSSQFSLFIYLKSLGFYRILEHQNKCSFFTLKCKIYSIFLFEPFLWLTHYNPKFKLYFLHKFSKLILISVKNLFSFS